MFLKLFGSRHSRVDHLHKASEQEKYQPLSSNIEQTITQIQPSFGHSPDLLVHRFQAFSERTECALVYLKSFTDTEELNKSVLAPLLQLANMPKDMQNLAKVLPQTGTQEITSLQEFSKSAASGQVVLLVSGFKSALKIPLQKYEQRAVTEPDTEKAVMGPRDGFVESLWSNVGLLRQKIKNPDLRLEVITLGTRTFTEVGIVYLEGIANRQIVDEIRRRVKRIKTDRVLLSNVIAEFTRDAPWSPFPTLQITERPERLAHFLLDGRVGIMVDGTPIVQAAPVVFWDFLKSGDDYIDSSFSTTFIRSMRAGSHLITLLVPGAYVALTTIHLQMLPQTLAVIIAGARTRTPFPVAVEMIVMELMVELLREAGLRMPGVFGQTMSIVGALVIGEAAVTAGLIEPIIVVLVAFTTLASFLVPNYNAAISVRLLRFPLIFLSASLGFFGLILGAMFYLIHLVSLRSFGVPYFAPLAPLFLKDLKDMFIRLPWWSLSRRPTYYRPEDEIRAAQNQKPGPEKD